MYVQNITLPETNSNIAPENGWLEYDLSPFRMAYSQGQSCQFQRVYPGLVHLELWHLPPCPTTSEPHPNDCKVPPHEVEFDLNKHVMLF